MTPEGRRDEVVDLLNRIITSAFIKVDERLFPKSGIDTDGYDIVTIETLLEEQKKQNALLENAKESIQREMEAEETSIRELESQKASLTKRVAQMRDSLPSLNKHIQDVSDEAQTAEEKAVQRHRHAYASSWRRQNGSASLASSSWWNDVKEAVDERIGSEKPLRKVVKRMAEVDSKLYSLLSL